VPDEGFDGLVDFFELLLVLDAGLFEGGPDGGAFVVGVLVGLVLHFDRYVRFLEVGLGGVVYLVLVVPQARQLEQVVLQDLRPFLLHVDLLRAPVAEVAQVNPQLRLRVLVLAENALAVRARKAELALVVLDGALGHAFAGAALVGGELGDGAVVAAVGGAGEAGEDLLLKNRPLALANDLDLRFVVIELVE
jgi:hypothetical protein